ncbi:MAG: hypothetical protein JXR83_01930, partial [Deltaproteobacteria bacterium]|nr:hypothetical protein [Deltaproteobacteria bacterium]
AGSCCLPVPTYPSGYLNLCLETSPAGCSLEYGTCTTGSGVTGYCLRLDTRSALRCYAICSTVETCPVGTGCVAYSPPDCDEVCSGLQCGVVEPCLCGQCPSPQRCEAHLCVDDCRRDCSDRECGDDLCGGVCGECGAGLHCNDDGRCVANAIADGGTDDQHTVSLCGCRSTAQQPIDPLAYLVATLGLLARRRQLGLLRCDRVTAPPAGPSPPRRAA